MILNQASNIMLGSTEVQRVYQGNVLVWERKKPHLYDPGKIAVVELDGNLNPTDNVQYFTAIANANYYLRGNPDTNYSVYIGENAEITSLSNFAFEKRENLISITIPESVTSIGRNAFNECTNLKLAEIHGDITQIAMYTFQSCTSLEKVNIPDSVTSIGVGAFSGCTSLAELDIPDTVTAIGNLAFSGSGIRYIRLHPESLELGNYVFSGTNVESVSISGVTKIGYNIFSLCSSLTNVEFDGIAVSASMFYQCTALTSVKLRGITEIEGRAFGCCSALTSIDFPDSVTHILSDACSDCDALTSISIGNGIAFIHQYAFRHTPALTSISIAVPKDSVTGAPWGATSTNITVSWG